MNKRQEQILKRIKIAHAKNDHTMNAEKLRKELGCSRQLVSRETLGLEAMGIIIRQPKYRPVDN